MFFQSSLPVVLYFFMVISENHSVSESYLYRIFDVLKIIDPVRLCISILIQPVIGVDYQSHHAEYFPQIKKYHSSWFSVHCPDKIREYVNKITNSMAAWKIFLFQTGVVRKRCPKLLRSHEDNGVSDIDSSASKSFSSEKEGAEVGFDKKAKGKPCFQLSASFIGRIFVDAKLFSGDCNPKVLFRKAVRRAKSLGLPFETVRADSAYLTLGNLLFLIGLSLGYAIGAPGTFSAVREGSRSFKEFARKKSTRIISVAKGVSISDLGIVSLSDNVMTRLIIVRRISRRKIRRTGKWKIRTYYHAIATNPNLSPAKLYAFHHKRQKIEAGFGELKYHHSLERLPFRNLKANEFRIACKIPAMTLFEMFQAETMPETYQTLLLKTFIRRFLQKTLKIDLNGKVEILSKRKNEWLLRRFIAKTELIKNTVNAYLSVA